MLHFVPGMLETFLLETNPGNVEISGRFYAAVKL